MTNEERLNYCRICTNRKLDTATGLVCALTSKKADFEKECPNFSVDHPALAKMKEKLELRKQEAEEGGFFGPEKKGIKGGVLGGVVMIIIAVVWFVLGLAADRIFFYPPVLFVIGIYAVGKGIATGNLAGKKEA